MCPASQHSPLRCGSLDWAPGRAGGRAGEAEPSAARACGGDLGGPRRHGGGEGGTGRRGRGRLLGVGERGCERDSGK